MFIVLESKQGHYFVSQDQQDELEAKGNVVLNIPSAVAAPTEPGTSSEGEPYQEHNRVSQLLDSVSSLSFLF